MAAHKVESTAAQRRKVTKPLMEKRRRARINHCLTELKRFLLAAEGDKSEDSGRSSKLEKADILEMTVRYLRQLNNQVTKPVGENEKYKAGYRQCMGEVARFVSITNPSLTSKFLDHLDQCLTTESRNHNRPPYNKKEDNMDGEKVLCVPCNVIQPNEMCHQKPVRTEMWRPW